ncbi:hypothetical protein PILCRDRAFT_817585 [Piloderma croceum F 1598]|uniref:Hydrophobin n=1 Tax=Piloderma croceum (strain F 1598) TaxID=765440 RepID=A0A0C3C579_PILCF|nr:hypothetical protein PILCRDRAFT_817585 [Piloderma croceum F 1598]
MFAKTLVAVSFAALAVAVPTGGSKQCETSKQNCCKSVQQAGNPDPAFLAGLLDLILPIDAQVGLTCSPISVVGTGSGCAESQTPVCCNENKFNGLINIGCTPIQALL